MRFSTVNPRIQTIFDSLRKDIKSVNNGSHVVQGNQRSHDEFLSVRSEWAPVIQFMRVAAKICYFSCEELMTELENQDPDWGTLIQYIISGIFVDAYRVGHCGEFADLGLMRLLQSGMHNNIDRIRIVGRPISDLCPKDHAFLVCGRNLSSNEEKVSQWGDIKVFDPWIGKITSFDKDNTLTMNALGEGLFCSVKDVEIVFSWNRCLTSVDCEFIVKALKLVQASLSAASLIRAAKDSGRKHVNIENELQSIFQRINESISSFNALKEHRLRVENFGTRPGNSHRGLFDNKNELQENTVSLPKIIADSNKNESLTLASLTLKSEF